MKKPLLIRRLIIVIVPVLFALLTRWLFDTDYWNDIFVVMSVSFVLFVPFSMGALTIYLASDIEKIRSRKYCFFMPWISVFIFLIITIAFEVEGWACWIMALPIFLLASSFGGLLAGHYKLKKHDSEKILVSLLALLPFLLSPVEQMIGQTPEQYKAYTYIDIHSSKEKIWSHVTRVKTIDKDEDKGWFTHFLGFPRPIQAELNYEGVGAFRKAIFDKGLVFDETVMDYQPQKKMVFSIKANPYNIPSTTMDKHIVVGGDYFDVLNGTYELQQLNVTTYRLHLYSHFKLTTTFNFYAGWWAEWIMKDIQTNILEVIKERSEKE